jgi:hypothetical protein
MVAACEMERLEVLRPAFVLCSYGEDDENSRGRCAAVGTSVHPWTGYQASELARLEQTHGRFGVCEVSRSDEQHGWDQLL